MGISRGYVDVSLSNATISGSCINLLSQHNVLIDNKKPPRACIADYGLCAVTQTASFGHCGVGGGGGTLGYMAPELFSEDVQASKEADMYAFGMLVYEVIVGVPPFVHRKQVELPGLTLGGSRPPRPEDPVAIGFGQGTWELAESCWNKDPRRRPTAREALEHLGRVAGTSKVVDPGPRIRVHEPPRVDGSSRNFCKCHDPAQCLRSDSTLANLFAQAAMNSSRGIRQAAFTPRLIIAGNSTLPIPTFHPNNTPGLLARTLRLITSPKPPHLLKEPPQGDN
jgi:serine/threonine protein kinase